MEINGEDLLRNGSPRKVDKSDSGEQITTGGRNNGNPYKQRDDAGLYERRGNRGNEYVDSFGRRISGLSEKQKERLRESVIRDSRGCLIPLYHFTSNGDFEKFAIGDVGFHFGTENDAYRSRPI